MVLLVAECSVPLYCNDYEYSDSPKVGENLYRSKTPINQPQQEGTEEKKEDSMRLGYVKKNQ